MKKDNVLTVLYIIMKTLIGITIIVCAINLGFTDCYNPKIPAILIIANYILDKLTTIKQ